MKTPALRIAIGTFAVLLAFLTSCKDEGFQKVTYIANVPIYQSFDDFRATQVSAEDAQPLTDPGKLFLKDQHLFVNDKYKGIHIIDNTNPAAPLNRGYISIPGNIDIAIRGSILYADSYIDLLTIDISDPTNPVLLSRNEGVFPNAMPAWDMNYPIGPLDANKGIIVGWSQEEITVTQDIQPNAGWGNMFVMVDQNNFDQTELATVTTSNNLTPGTGISGSMARFVLNGDFLYTVNDQQMQSFNISNPGSPSSNGNISIGRTVETVSPMSDYLFIGTSTGMLIYSVIDDPSQPTFVSVFEHATMCDPVVVDGDHAYITLRSGTFCGGWQSFLDVVNISNLEQPYEVASRNMDNPYGVGIDDGTLFVCDGTSGLKVYDASNLPNLTHLSTLGGMNAYDVIPYDGVVLLTSPDGIFQYDYTNPYSLQELSVIPVE